MWPKYWSFSISPSNEYSGLISFRIDWFDLLVFCQAPGMQSCSIIQSCLTLCDPMNCSTPASLPFTISWSMLKLTFIESVMPSNHLILCHPLLLPSIFPSIRVLSNESALCITWPKYWRFSFSPSDEYSGLISFRIDWFDLLVFQGTLQSLLQHHSSKASVEAYGSPVDILPALTLL